VLADLFFFFEFDFLTCRIAGHKLAIAEKKSAMKSHNYLLFLFVIPRQKQACVV